ncbi:hypothetical protein HS1genome_2005 [Sulfodiicoccus acidiphilus]|uniref:ATPase domain-containing protein n=1 Tax=Sulfodiicoccus acidiphilus TaxID=1670455 RepID=A0A348B614_9CREN|nr:hypothetical protein [Sulfodiicoccus acidiphilus]BBD73616.1 hypothetical protein HS1genome_2005 [Sulfodiicoccus acidiphilus]GGU04733.1 hypothetical protein GCM10007116_21680 [Sulfodiicoccus acidiphilus]
MGDNLIFVDEPKSSGRDLFGKENELRDMDSMGTRNRMALVVGERWIGKTFFHPSPVQMWVSRRVSRTFRCRWGSSRWGEFEWVFP